MTDPFEKKILWGQTLLEAIKETRISREPLIEGILFKKSIQMKFAAEGIGKSLLSLQEAVQGTVDGSKVFGEFLVPKAFNTLYLQMERPEDEVLERLKTMIQYTAFDANRFVLDNSFQEFNFKNDFHVKAALDRVKKIITQTFGYVDLIKLDPIYPMIVGGLRDDEGASRIINFSKLLQNKFNCSVDMIHHVNRGQRNKETAEREGRDMFGSGLFAWHCTGIYKISKTSEGTHFKAEKSNQTNLERHFDLIYNPESQLSFVKNAQGKMSKSDLLLSYLRACKQQDKPFTFSEMQEVSGLSTSFVRNFCGGHPQNGLKIVGKSATGAHLYKYEC